MDDDQITQEEPRPSKRTSASLGDTTNANVTSDTTAGPAADRMSAKGGATPPSPEKSTKSVGDLLADLWVRSPWYARFMATRALFAALEGRFDSEQAREEIEALMSRPAESSDSARTDDDEETARTLLLGIDVKYRTSRLMAIVKNVSSTPKTVAVARDRIHRLHDIAEGAMSADGDSVAIVQRAHLINIVTVVAELRPRELMQNLAKNPEPKVDGTRLTNILGPLLEDDSSFVAELMESQCPGFKKSLSTSGEKKLLDRWIASCRGAEPRWDVAFEVINALKLCKNPKDPVDRARVRESIRTTYARNNGQSIGDITRDRVSDKILRQVADYLAEMGFSTMTVDRLRGPSAWSAPDRH